MTPSGPFWSLLTILGPILLIVAIAWSMLKNRKEPKSEIEQTERATHDLYKAQDEQDKREEARIEHEKLEQAKREHEKHARDRSDDAAN